MRIRYMIIVSFSFKLGLILFCLSLWYAQGLLGQSFFNTLLSGPGYHEAVRRAFNRNIRNDLGLTGYMFAAIYGEENLARSLFEYGANLNLQSTKERQTALHFSTNNMRALQSQKVGYYLIDVYADTMLRNIFGQTPLHLVISTDVVADRNKMVAALLKNGADINAQTNQGDTLMHLAVNMKGYEWVEDLLERWYSLINFSVKNRLGFTPAEYADHLGFQSIEELFLKPYKRIAGAAERDSNGLTGLMLAVMRRDQKTVDVMVKTSAALNLRSNDSYQNSALHIALICQNVAAVTSLLKSGASLTVQNAQNELPTHFLVRVWDTKKRLQVAPLLLKKDPNTIVAPNIIGNNLLHYIVQYNDMPLLNYLVKNHKQLATQAVITKNKALLDPRQLAFKLNRQQMVPILNRLALR